jgi:hypothetical protein
VSDFCGGFFETAGSVFGRLTYVKDGISEFAVWFLL